MRKSVGNRKIIMSDEYAGGRKIGLDRVKCYGIKRNGGDWERKNVM
jgi:hypothetical protein